MTQRQNQNNNLISLINITRNSINIWGLITICKCSINECKCFKLLDIPSYNTAFVIFKDHFHDDRDSSCFPGGVESDGPPKKLFVAGVMDPASRSSYTVK